MIKLSFLLKEILINEYNKSQLEYIAFKLGIERGKEFDSLLNALDAQGIKYPDLKNKIVNGNIKSFEDLKKLKLQSKSDVAKASKSDSEVVYEDKDKGIFVVIPYTHAASCYYGAGTKWCTTDKDITNWKEYIVNGEGTLYYIINKNLSESNPLYKVAVLVDSNSDIDQIFDATDKEISTNFFTTLKKQIGYDLRDKIDFKSKSEIILPSAEKEVEEYASKIVQKYIKNGSKGNLNIIERPLLSLPQNLKVGGSLTLMFTGIKSLPSGLIIGKDLNITHEKNLKSLPPDIQVGRNIRIGAIEGGLILPDNLTVNGNLDISDSGIENLPNGLKVGKDLDLGGLDISLESLPKDLVVQGKLLLFNTDLSAKYYEEELTDLIKKQCPGVKKITTSMF